MNDSASERDDAVLAADDAADAPASPRRVLNPDLLWVESVTERLLGNSEPPTWERAPIGEQVTGGARPAADEAATTTAPEPAPGTFEPAPEAGTPSTAGESGQPVAEVHRLPVRTPRAVTRPLSYAEVLADRPRIRLTEEPPPVPYFATDPAEQQAEPARPAEPRAVPRAVPPTPAAAARGEDMPAGVLRAALRDALPDDTARRSSAVDAVFGDPSWRVEPEPTEPEPTAPEPTEPAAAEPEPAVDEPAIDESETQPAVDGPAAAAAPAAAPPAAAPAPTADEPLAPRAPTAQPDPAAAPAAPTGRHRTPEGGDPGTDVAAIRMALRSGDEGLAAAVLALVADRGRERERVRMVEAYLDAVLAEGDDGLAGAARLRRLLGE